MTALGLLGNLLVIPAGLAVVCLGYLFFSAISGRLFAFLERYFSRHQRSVQP